MQSRTCPKYSFVIPVFNEEAVLEELHHRLSAVADKLDGESEFVLVDDGSTDESPARMHGLRERDRWREGFEVVHAARPRREGESRLRASRLLAPPQ